MCIAWEYREKNGFFLGKMIMIPLGTIGSWASLLGARFPNQGPDAMSGRFV